MDYLRRCRERHIGKALDKNGDAYHNGAIECIADLESKISKDIFKLPSTTTPPLDKLVEYIKGEQVTMDVGFNEVMIEAYIFPILNKSKCKSVIV